MIGVTRGISTLAGAAVAGILLWFATQIGTETSGGVLGDVRPDRRGGPDDGALADPRRLDEVGVAAVLARRLRARLPARARRRRLDPARAPAGRLDEHVELVTRPRDLRRRRGPRQHPAGDRASGSGSCSGCRSTRPGRSRRSWRGVRCERRRSRCTPARRDQRDARAADEPLTADRGPYAEPPTVPVGRLETDDERERTVTTTAKPPTETIKGFRAGALRVDKGGDGRRRRQPTEARRLGAPARALPRAEQRRPRSPDSRGPPRGAGRHATWPRRLVSALSSAASVKSPRRRTNRKIAPPATSERISAVALETSEREHPDPEQQEEEDGPEKRLDALVDARHAQVHGAILATTRNGSRRPTIAERAPTPTHAASGVWRETGSALADPVSVRAKKFREPVALSSTEPADFPLARTALELGFDLIALRAPCKENITGLPGPGKARGGRVSANCVNFSLPPSGAHRPVRRMRPWAAQPSGPSPARPCWPPSS